MKPAMLRRLGAAAVTGALIWLVPSTRGQDLAEDTSTDVLDNGTAGAAPDIIRRVPPGLEELTLAGTPSDVAEAYSRARLNADSLVVDEMYMRRMVELGAPDLCESQAARLTRNVPDDGLAWAVLAFNSARENDFGTALAQLARAARYDPRNPFVQRIGGQLLAWCDTQSDPSRLPSTMREAARNIRSALGGKSDFAEAYREASQYYRENGQSPTESPAPEAAPTEPAQDVAIYDPGNVDSGYSYSPYPVYGGSYVGYPWYTNGSWTGSVSVAVPIDRYHWRRYDHSDRPRGFVRGYHGSRDARRPDHSRPASDIIRGSGNQPRSEQNPAAVPRASAGAVGTNRHPAGAAAPGPNRVGSPAHRPPRTPGIRSAGTPASRSPTPSHHGSVTRPPEGGRAPSHVTRSAAPAPRPAAVPRQAPSGRRR